MPVAAPAAFPVLAPTAAAPSFLAETARHLLDRYGAGPADELSELVVVVPTRRAVVYLKNELALALPPGAALWAPRVAAMEDYMVELAGVQVEEPIALQLLLFDILRGYDTSLNFDRFVGWSGLLLSDFSNLDQNLATPRKVFEYLSQAKALERWDLEVLPERSRLAGRSFSFWDQLERVYRELKRRMLAQHLAYPGLAYRLAVKKMQARLDALDAAPGAPAVTRHVFVGLGNLSKAEEKLIRLLYRAGRAELRFDGDPFYLAPDSPNRAGQHLREYARKWDLPLGALGGGTECLLGVANPSMQGKLAGQLLAEARRDFPAATVAVVLPDETLLLPVLHGLPPDAVPAYNVTMGLSFQATPLFNLVDLLFEVHLTGIREGSAETGYGVPRYHHLAVSKLLAHPFLRRYQLWLNQQPDPKYHGILDHVCREIVRLNAVLLPAADLLALGQHQPLLEALFQTWNNCDDIIRACYTLIDLLRQVYTAEKPSPDHEPALGAEYLYLFYTLVKQLDSAFDCREQRLSVASFRRFLYEQMARTRLPFSGEPLADVQVMGLLETRALDFDHVIILSCNEGILPAPKRQQSLFPYDVLKEFGLPTHADAEAGTAYNFWRLLQRARRVDLVHVLPGAEGTKSGERSRFLLQLENDLRPQNPLLTVEDLTVAVPNSAEATASYAGDFVLEKDAELLGALRGVLERNISPSRLNDFLACSLRFYFSKVARFHENEAVEETLEASSFGTMVHAALENLLRPFEQDARPLTAADLPALLAQVPAEVGRALRQEDTERYARPDEGLNHVYGQVATRLVMRYLQGLPAREGLPLRLFSLEKPLAATVFVDVPGSGALAVRLFGMADRVDQLPDGRLRVVDYKTGLVEANDLNLTGYRNRLTPAEATERLLTEASSSADKVRQLWLYRFMLASTEKRETANTAIVSMRNLDAGLLSADLSFLTAEGEDFVQVSEELITKIVLRILDPAEPIRKTDDFAKCEFCDYRGICAR